jgi:alkanesulfonate monooxygenase SsuD/methylene tetrahydromethanopterin reductase-like flavin-dependent oxidoreductase (luciferase family)
MKFGLLLLPTIPATMDERERMRPIAARSERFQMMIDEVIEFARIAEDLGIDMLAFPEHHLHTEGIEMGSVPQLHLFVAMHTKHLKVGPIGYVLPGWNPLRLAVEIGWLDQLTRGRSFVGFARGYQARWLNQMGQKLHVSAATSDQSEIDRTNRKVFEEVFQILKLAWGDEPFTFKGDHYEYPYPYETGTPWPAHEFTAQYGAPGEVVDGKVKKIFVVPKPYQRPHPPLFQAFSISDETILWCARQGIVPMTLVTLPQSMARIARLFQDESAKSGRKLELGERLGALRQFYFGRNKEEAMTLAEAGSATVAFKRFWGYFGFYEAFRLPGDEEKWPAGKVQLPHSEWTVDRMDKAHYLFAGSESDIRRKMDQLIEASNPEYFLWNFDQGFLPREVMKDQLRQLGEKILPHYR